LKERHKKMKNIIHLLEERGLIESVSNPDLKEISKQPLKVYAGFDPTADSLHIGNLVGIIVLAWFQKLGHYPVAVIGGATGMIGDPSGKSSERVLLDQSTIEKNILGIKKSLETVLDFNHPTAKATLLNNFDWFQKFGFIDFLRDVGKHFRLGTMLTKDSVKSRLQSEEGISYTEFSYQLLQAYDFLYLNENYGVTLQLGGSDQWGNIVAGIELIRKVKGKAAQGLTFPLLTRSDGKKFGKSEEGTIWLSKDKLSSYQFYQYFLRIPDLDVIKLMRMLTFMEMEEINDIQSQMQASNYVPNTAQKRLAEEITLLIHKKEGLEQALRLTENAAPGAKTALDAGTLQAMASEMPSYRCKSAEIINQPLINLLVVSGLQSSKAEARRLIANGGVYLNNEKVSAVDLTLQKHHLIDQKWMLIAIGKKHKMVVHVD
jgi:tyrosyl-tRNA synthetase